MNNDGIEVKIGNSAFYFKLGNLLDKKKISKNKLSQDTETESTTLHLKYRVWSED